jgi:anthranilate synthase component 1
MPQMTPSLFDSLRAEYDVIPLVRELSADAVTPVAAFHALAGDSGEAFLLESVERGENVGRYSFVGFAPRKAIRFERGAADPIGRLRGELYPLRVWGEAELPPFFGGAVGYFAYGAAGWAERIPDRHEDPYGMADARLLIFDRLVVFDHVRQRLLAIVNMFTSDAIAEQASVVSQPGKAGPQRGTAELIADARRRLDEMVAGLRRASLDSLDLDTPAAGADFQANCTREDFESMVRHAKEEIVAGEIFQIVLSQRWSTAFDERDALTLYRCLRSINPSPYMFLLRTADCTLVGSSPEMLVRVQGRNAEMRPIAGTRPRGRSRDEDSALERELLADPKERAEHLMLVDLGRNDLGRVCAAGSIAVHNFCRVESYSHVMHLVTDVTGTLRSDCSPVDALLSCFPAGTLSGAPKIRAMELIDRFELERRGPYGGAVAYVGFSGNLDSCITIRTIVLTNGRALVQAGAGIVYDSQPSREYEEALSKSEALKRAIALARAVVAASAAAERPRELDPALSRSLP